MKHNILFLLAGLVFLASCQKDTTDKLSQVFKVPTIEVNDAIQVHDGGVISIPVGSVYEEKGATFTDEDGSTRVVQPVSGEVNTAVAGLYPLTYTQESASGIYEVTTYKYVAVTNVNNPVDYSGAYLRAATGVIATVTKLGNGLYEVHNPGGAGAGASLYVYFVETSLNNFVSPPQPTGHDGETSVTDISFTATGSSWKIVNAGYGAQLRFFDKQ